ncbi:Leucine-rich repeat-containing N-terminal, plant-type [Sesbania bispinosa]|nr:Leucine-rich repeat-containing N-terminal, plant-type [Sesbania bispinosa]
MKMKAMPCCNSRKALSSVSLLLRILSYPKIASWNGTTDWCSWDGIECDEQRGHVIDVDLSSSQLYGSMDADSSLFRLPHLQRFDLADNDFNYSKIPSTIGE